jgi:hypothetical protein
MLLRNATRPGAGEVGHALQKGERQGRNALVKPLTLSGRPHAICREGLQKPSCLAASVMQFVFLCSIAHKIEVV